MDLYGLCSYSCSRLLASASHLGQMPHADSVLWWAPTCSTVLLARIIDLTWRWMETSLSDIGTLPLCASHVWFNVPAQHRKMTSPANLLGHLMVQQWRSHNTSKLLKTPDIAVICSDKRQAVQMQSDSVWVVEPQLLYLEAERKLKTAASKCKANAKQTQSKCKANAKQMESKCKANAKQMQSKCKANAKENSAWINAEPKQQRFWERNWISKGDHWEPFANGVLTVGCSKNASVALSAPSLLW